VAADAIATKRPSPLIAAFPLPALPGFDDAGVTPAERTRASIATSA
jgi:hypothetical protein